MEQHSNISGFHAKGGWISNSSSHPEIQNQWIANFVESISSLKKQIEVLQSLLAARGDAESIDEYYERVFLASMYKDESREQANKSQNKKSRKRAGISRLNPQSPAQTVSSRNNPPTTHALNKETHFHAKKK